MSFDPEHDICERNHGGDINSVAAHMSVIAKKADMQRAILAELERTGGATCDELERALGIAHQTASARCSELLASGQVARTGRRKTRTGRSAWVLTVCRSGECG